MMDKRLLDILCCPVSKTPLRSVTRPQLEALNEAIAAGNGSGAGGHDNVSRTG